mmetsp:Transcript_1086/g.2140  ORF Transcript_1086/g.2140 Transcript_1086/m.2140 type:complete len:499 (+) Transcript_1086:558-2054(+)
MKSAKLCSRPKAPTTLGPLRIITAAQIFRSAYIRNAKATRSGTTSSKHCNRISRPMPNVVSVKNSTMGRPLNRRYPLLCAIGRHYFRFEGLQTPGQVRRDGVNRICGPNATLFRNSCAHMSRKRISPDQRVLCCRAAGIGIQIGTRRDAGHLCTEIHQILIQQTRFYPVVGRGRRLLQGRAVAGGLTACHCDGHRTDTGEDGQARGVARGEPHGLTPPRSVLGAVPSRRRQVRPSGSMRGQSGWSGNALTPPKRSRPAPCRPMPAHHRYSRRPRRSSPDVARPWPSPCAAPPENRTAKPRPPRPKAPAGLPSSRAHRPEGSWRAVPIADGLRCLRRCRALPYRPNRAGSRQRGARPGPRGSPGRSRMRPPARRSRRRQGCRPHLRRQARPPDHPRSRRQGPSHPRGRRQCAGSTAWSRSRHRTSAHSPEPLRRRHRSVRPDPRSPGSPCPGPTGGRLPTDPRAPSGRCQGARNHRSDRQLRRSGQPQRPLSRPCGCGR